MDTVIAPAAKPRRTKPRGRHPDKALSAAFIRSAPPGRHADGNGLFLYVKPEGTRSWIQRLVVRGRRREFGLGAVGLVSLAEAREVALANRKLARSGGDPLADKHRVQGVPTFAEAAQRALEQKRGGWRGRWHVHNWWRSLERYAFPRIGSRPVSEVNTADVLEILTPIWHVKAATARRPHREAERSRHAGPQRTPSSPPSPPENQRPERAPPEARPMNPKLDPAARHRGRRRELGWI
ncbi:MAG: Arm DNA-binding domain-containing protein [Acidobacteria bacterium]|nr:Arm DNA-binding domain-containing protein [Acidobacteriota bacterium]